MGELLGMGRDGPRYPVESTEMDARVHRLAATAIGTSPAAPRAGDPEAHFA